MNVGSPLPSWDVVFVGGGLANGLIAYRLAQRRPALTMLVLESGRSFGGNHTWSFHATDITPDQTAWTDRFVVHRWPFYHVAFPGLHRRVDIGYRSITSERFHEVLTNAAIPVRFGVEAEAVAPTEVRLAGGERITAGAIVDGRGVRAMPALRLGFQKFVGRELQLAEPHRLMGPILMDATVAQDDGYRFVYVLPFAADRLMIEDTYYADAPQLDIERLRTRIDDYARDKGWRVTAVLREETGVLPITLAGDIDAFWADDPGQPRVGLRAGLFHPTTGYSFADAVRLADRIAALDTLDAAALADVIQAHARTRWRAQRYFRALNRMLFQAGPAGQRWAVMRRFNRFPEAVIRRFYAGELSAGDKLRLLMGKPPVPIAGAVRALMDNGVSG